MTGFPEEILDAITGNLAAEVPKAIACRLAGAAAVGRVERLLNSEQVNSATLALLSESLAEVFSDAAHSHITDDHRARWVSLFQHPVNQEQLLRWVLQWNPDDAPPNIDNWTIEDAPDPEHARPLLLRLHRVIQEKKHNHFPQEFFHLLSGTQARKAEPVDRNRRLDQMMAKLGAQPRPHPAVPRSAAAAARAVHNLPFASLKEHLKGREAALESLARWLEAPAAGAAVLSQPPTAHPLGGVGKTRLAVELAWQALNERRVEVALFVMAGDSWQGLLGRLGELAAPDLLNLPEAPDADPAARGEAVVCELARRKRWMLIFDGVDTDAMAQQIVGELLPRLAGHGHVVLTSSLEQWPSEFTQILVEKLPVSKAAAYMLERTGGRRQPEADDFWLAELLSGPDYPDGLPIALLQASAYVRRRRITLHIYRVGLDLAASKLSGEPRADLRSLPRPLLLAYCTTEQQLRPGELPLLRLASFLSSLPIAVARFEQHTELVQQAILLLCAELRELAPSPEDPLPDIRALLTGLDAWGMVRLSGDSFTIHPLVQHAARLSIPPDQAQAWADLAGRL